MKLGLVTYNLAKDWDLDRIVEMCSAHGFQGVELRTTHAHGVEVSLDGRRRDQVRKKFQDGPVALAGLGSAFEYHSNDPAEVRRNIEGTKEYAQLAADVGAPGIKVRPNGLQTDVGVPEETTLRQIGEFSPANRRAYARSWITPTTRTPSSAGTPIRAKSRTAPSRAISTCWPIG